MNYSAINIQGNIVSSEILEKVRTEDIRYQKASDFGMNPSASVRDEINLAWSLAVSNWNAFKSKRENLSDTDSGTAETRRYWMLPLLQVLGYELTTSTAELINGKTYAISHRATNRDGFPIHVVGVNQSLDKRAESGGTRLSPHALVQEYLNNNEHMYALVSNGRFLRVLRDATRLSRLSYLEFDLEQIMEEGLYVEFALLYRVLHASRMPEKQDSGAECFLEFYHQEALASGSRIRERLSVAVENSIKELANGLLQNPNNQELRDKVLNQQISSKEYYLHTLRLVYRVLFLLVIEERKLIYPEKRDEKLNRKRSIYYEFYSIQRLTKLAEKLIYVDPRKTDLWQSLITTFALFEHEQFGTKLGISPLGAGIFSPDALGIISHQFIDNETLLRVLRYLVTFENEQGQRVRVNYADLDVEEFGSVYEGLLDYDPEITDNAGQPIFGFVKGDDRSSSGSHYTPEELVRPLIKHSLDYLIEDKLKEADPEKGLLSLTICDVACGSGHILLSAARRVGFELAKVRSKEDQPTPSVLRVAVRDVIRHCIYGVDLNPLAVELCKVALWLEAHEPGEPLNFLDHHIKCGNAIVGLAHAEELENGIASDAFKTLPRDEKEIAAAFKKRNDQELKTSGQLSTFDVGKVDNELKDVQGDFLKFSQLPETTPEQIAKKEKAYQDLTNGKKWWRLKNLADLRAAQFFIPKTTANKEKLTTHSQYMTYLKQGTQIFDRGASMAISQEKRFFHWFLEFPEVFQNGGFDCILGNPPFLGDRRLKEAYGEEFLEWIRFNYTEGATVDLVVYFFLRINDLLAQKGFQSLISTNTVAQGKAREFGLEKIIAKGSVLNHAVKGMKWPGLAAVEVSLITIVKGDWKGKYFLNGAETNQISAFLDEADNTGTPFPLFSNDGKSYQGSIVLGKGFILEPNVAKQLIQEDSKNKEVIFPYLNGDDLNNNPDQGASRFVINFFDWEESKASNFSIPYNILLEKVKPERQRWKEDKDGNAIIGEYALRNPLPQKWWQHCEKRPALYSKVNNYNRVLVSCRVSKYVNQSFVEISDSLKIFDVATTVVMRSEFWEYAFLQSSIHDHWAWKYASTLESRIRYVNVDCIDTFPILDDLVPTLKEKLEKSGDLYHSHRKQLMIDTQLGLTKTYNLFHSTAINSHSLNKADKQVSALKMHLEKCSNTISFNEAVQGILKLRELHKEMDEAVLEAYGWHQDDPKWGKAIQLRHDFYEVDYLPENDRVRYTIHPEARKEVLKRLLQLNHERYAEEVAEGLHEKKGAKKDLKEKKPKATKKVLPDDQHIQQVLFPEPERVNSPQQSGKTIVKLGSIVWLKAADGKEIKIACGTKVPNTQFMNAESAFVKALLGKSEGDQVGFGNGFEVLKIN
jgi:N-6 DNA Methylase